jgi:outer membrane protein assembly factor BamD (BamD/ComL family)
VREARDRLRGGDGRGALESLTSLARDIPGGTLIQEREALFIEALSATGRTAEARTHARHFLQRYPASAFVGRVRPFADASP